MRNRYGLFLLLVAMVILLFVSNKYTYTFEFKDGELYSGPLESPTGEYTANAYYKTYGGAAGGVDIWVEITPTDESDEIKTVYYAPGNSIFFMEWVDEENLRIVNDTYHVPEENRSVELRIGEEIYDESGAACSSFVMKDEYTTCYDRDAESFFVN